ncbi:MAG TPA: tetratricopeptide repeat protein [Solirubrobacteraceae bacterium]|nr:tetratricopeptide repeat protein [Solirubrobacteraceae bacterium]
MSSSRNRSTPAVPALEQARTNYELALAYDPKTVGWPGLHLGRLLYLSGDLHAAGDAFRASIATGHVAYAPVASYHLARLHEELGDTDTAIAAYRQASESLDPKQASAAIYKLGCLLKGNGEIAAARTAFQRAAAMTNTWYGHLADNALRTLG